MALELGYLRMVWPKRSLRLAHVSLHTRQKEEVMTKKYDYIDCNVDNLIGYSAEFWHSAMTPKTYRKCIAKAVKECDHVTLSWLAATIMRAKP